MIIPAVRMRRAHRLRLVPIAALIAGALAALSATPASATPASATPASATPASARPGGAAVPAPTFIGTHLRKAESNLCLVAQAGPGERPVIQTQCAGFADQGWAFRDVGNGRYQIFSTFLADGNGNAMCLVSRGSGETPAVATTCDSFADQFWTADEFLGLPFPHDKNAWRFESANPVNSNHCLVARGTSQATKTTCAMFSDQFWVLDS